jgi:hypothetical protein
MRPATHERKPETVIDLEHFVKSYAQIIVTQLYCYKENTQLISPAQLG